jgi:dolichol-phosphate mannosyltransferase
MFSIVIPTINEEKNICLTINRLLKIFKNIIFEIIIIDDKSSDNTVSEVKKLKNKLNLKITILINNHPKGLGNALLLGYNLSKYNFVMFLDADLSIKESDIYKLYKYRKKNSIIIGSRYIAKSKIIGVPKIKIYLSKLLNKFVSYIFDIPVSDISHSFRIISKKITLNSKNLTHPGFFWETTFDFKIKGFEIQEIPVTFIDRRFGLSKNYSVKMLKSSIISILNILIYKKFCQIP